MTEEYYLLAYVVSFLNEILLSNIIVLTAATSIIHYLWFFSMHVNKGRKNGS